MLAQLSSGRQLIVAPTTIKAGQSPIGARRTLVSGSNLSFVLQSLADGRSAVTIDIETTGLNPRIDEIVGLAVYDAETNSTYYFPFQHVLSNNLSRMDTVQKIHRSLLHRPQIYHNANFDWRFLSRLGWTTLPTHDTMILVSVVDFARPKGLKSLSTAAGYQQPELTEIVDLKKHTCADVTAIVIFDYVCCDVEFTWLHFTKEYPRLEGKPQAQIYQLEMALLPATMEMENNGVPVSLSVLANIESTYQRLLEENERATYLAFQTCLGCRFLDSSHLLGENDQTALIATSPVRCSRECSPGNKLCEFPIHSVQRMSQMLFKILNLPTEGIKRTKTSFSTNVDTLTYLRDVRHIGWIQFILNYKEALKALGMARTYRAAVQSDGNIHTQLLQVHVVSGRYASSDPNMQQVPNLRRGLGVHAPSFRTAFLADATEWFLSIDFSQIEIRIFAALAGAVELLNALNTGADVHTRTASMVFDIPESQVSNEQRTSSKTTAFGLIYGQSVRGLADKLGIPESRAQQIVDRFFAAIPEFPRFIQITHRFALSNGGIYTQFGRWVPIPNVYSKDRWERAKALRLSVNARVQGSAADVLKIVTAKVYAFIKSQYGDQVKLRLTVHDELLFTVAKELDPIAVADGISAEMRFQFGPVWLEVEAKYGQDWGNLRPIHDKKPDIVDIQTAVVIDHVLANQCPQDVLDILSGMQAQDGYAVEIRDASTGQGAVLPYKVKAGAVDLLNRLVPGLAHLQAMSPDEDEPVVFDEDESE